MDPFTGIALLAAKYGARKVTEALFGEGAEADLAVALVGLLEATEQSHARLLEIERRLDVLIEQRYQVASGKGLRYLHQALLPGRAADRRGDDLTRAEDNLVEAAEASGSPLQRALCERLLLVVRLARRDRQGAADSQVRLDLELGEAVTSLWTLISAPREPRRFLSRDRNRPRVEQLWHNTDVELAAITGLFADAAMFARELNLPSPTATPAARSSPADDGTWLRLPVPPGETRIGGITCVARRTGAPGRQTWSVRVHLSPRRRTALTAGYVANWPDTGFGQPVPAILGQDEEVRPGDTVALRVKPESLEWQDKGNWPTGLTVGLSGLVLQTSA